MSAFVAVCFCALLVAVLCAALLGGSQVRASAVDPVTPVVESYGYDAPSASTTSPVNTRAGVSGIKPPAAGDASASMSAISLRRAAKGERTLYRAVGPEELDDIAKNGLRPNPSGRGYQTEKLFTGSAEDAARQAQIAHTLSGGRQASTIIEARFPSGVDILRGGADSMDIFSVSAGSLGRGRVSQVFNYSPLPR